VKKLVVILAMSSLIACNNSSDNSVGTVTDSIDTVNVAAPVDTASTGSDSAGTKVNIIPTSDSASKASQQ